MRVGSSIDLLNYLKKNKFNSVLLLPGYDPNLY